VESFGHASLNPFEEFFTPAEVLRREFDGGWAGAGHDQDNYISYLSLSVGDNELDQFFASIDEAGFTQQGQANAIDVSLVKPEDS
jgi:hypothetical protein